MSGPHRPPPPIIHRQKVAEDGTSGAKVQMQMLCRFLLKDLLDQADEDIEATFRTYGDNVRDLYDVIIEAVNNEPATMQRKHSVSRINNIFDVYAGIAPEQRAYKAPADLKVFKHVGFTTHDGGFAPVPSLTPSLKAPPARSPIRTVPFPPANPNINPMGYTSPTSPGEREMSVVWPLKQSFLDQAGDRRLNTSCKIPAVHRQETRDVRIGDGSVRDPSKVRSVSRSYKEAASGSGLGPDRRLPSVSLPGQQQPGSSSGFKIQTGAPDIKLGINRDITPYESSAWVPRIEQASKAVTDYLRHGFDDHKYNIHSSDGYVRVAMLVQLPQFKKWNIDKKVLEVIMMHGRQRLMLNHDKTKIRAVQGHTLDLFEYDRLYERIISIPFFENWREWGGNTPNMAVV